MAHDVFISYSSRDKTTADAVCAVLESRDIRCWVAPRDILPGVEYAEALVDALHQSRLMVLVFSSGSNQSPHVLREVERAVSQGIPILPLRIEDVPPSRAMEYYIASRHWLDALTPPLERHLEQLAQTAKLLLTNRGASQSESPHPPRSSQPDVGTPPEPNYSATDVRFGTGMAHGAVLPRLDGDRAIVEALHSIPASIQRLREWHQIKRARATVAAHPAVAIAVVAALILTAGGLLVWTTYHSNPIRLAQEAFESGKFESALRHLDRAGKDPKAAVLKGRALYSLKRQSEGIAQYKEAAASDPQLLVNPDILRDLSESLGSHQSQDAVELMVEIGDPAVNELVDASRDTQNSRRRWAAIDALRRMKHEDRADLVAAYLLDLKSHDCPVVQKAAKALGDLGDKRAVQPLRDVAQRKNLFFDACEAAAARAALKKLEKK